MNRKKWLAAGAVSIVTLGAIGTVVFLRYQKQEEERSIPQLPEGMSLSGEVVSATGLTSVGMEEETWKLDFLEKGLYVEESYLNVGDEVEAHTPVFKVSEDSLAAARTELEKEVTRTALLRRQGEVTYQTGLVDAQQEKELAAVEASYAQAVYDAAVKEAQDEVDELQEQAEEAQELVEEYTASAESDYYYTYYEVGELETKWKDYAGFLMELYNTWNVAELESIYGGSGGKNGVGYVTNQVSQADFGSDMSGQGDDAGGEESGQGAGNVSQAMPDAAPAGGDYFAQEQIVTETESEPESENEPETESEPESENEPETGSEPESGGEPESENEPETGSEPESGSEPETESAPTGEKPSGGAPSGGFPGGGGFGGMVSGNDIPAGGGATVGDDEIRYNIYLAMAEEADEIGTQYETAKENYEDAKEKAAAGLAEAKSELAVRKAKLEEQKIAYEQAVLEAKQTYDLAVADSENAQMVYESTVRQLEEDRAALQDEEENAADNLAVFEETIGDGVFYTGEAGTVVMNQVRADTWLTERIPVLAYSNPAVVSVSANVSQKDIASVSIGEEVCVIINEYGSFSGTVTSFNPVSASGSASSVIYTVNVELEGDVDELESNLTAYVYLGLTEEEKELLEKSLNQQPGAVSGNAMPKEQPDAAGSGEMPDGTPGKGGNAK